MADSNIKEFTVTWTLFGLLFICLIGFAVSFMFNNNLEGLGDTSNFFEDSQTGLEKNLIELPGSGDELLNITAKTNPEESFLGSRDSVATTYSLIGTSRGFLDSSKILLSWIFSGTVGKMLLAVFGGLFSIAGLYWIVKLVRTGG